MLLGYALRMNPVWHYWMLLDIMVNEAPASKRRRATTRMPAVLNTGLLSALQSPISSSIPLQVTQVSSTDFTPANNLGVDASLI